MRYQKQGSCARAAVPIVHSDLTFVTLSPLFSVSFPRGNKSGIKPLDNSESNSRSCLNRPHLIQNKTFLMRRLDRIEDWADRARQAKYDAGDLANVCTVSSTTLRRYFNLVYGRPPQDWLNELRIWHAMELLCDGLGVKEVASQLNFGGSSHLCHRFKEYHGCTPMECVLAFRLRSFKAEKSVGQDAIALPWKTAEYSLLRKLPNRAKWDSPPILNLQD